MQELPPALPLLTSWEMHTTLPWLVFLRALLPDSLATSNRIARSTLADAFWTLLSTLTLTQISWWSVWHSAPLITLASKHLLRSFCLIMAKSIQCHFFDLGCIHVCLCIFKPCVTYSGFVSRKSKNSLPASFNSPYSHEDHEHFPRCHHHSPWTQPEHWSLPAIHMTHLLVLNPMLAEDHRRTCSTGRSGWCTCITRQHMKGISFFLSLVLNTADTILELHILHCSPSCDCHIA